MSIRDVFISFVIIIINYNNNYYYYKIFFLLFFLHSCHLSPPSLLEQCCSVWALDGDGKKKKQFCNKGYVMNFSAPKPPDLTLSAMLTVLPNDIDRIASLVCVFH